MNRYFAALFLWMLAVAAAQAANLVVSAQGPLRSIKQAVAQAQPGDHILIKSAVYTEGEITIGKPLTLQGENFPVLDGGGNSQLLTITSDGVTIKGLHFRNTGSSSLNDLAGIKILNARHVLVEGNKFTECFFGVYLSKSDSCTVRGNTVTTENLPETMRANGIHMWKCRNILVEQNHVTGQRDGIYLEFTTYSEIRENLTEQNIRYGLHFMFSDNDIYTHNTFRNNGAGVAVMYTHSVTMTDNVFEQNWGSAAYGLLLKDISRSTIKNNTFFKNTTGLYMEGSNKINITGNNFQQNGWAVKLLANCMEDTFALNNFTSNTFDLACNGMTVMNHINQNYWDKYQGYDLDKNQLGDVPYRPVSLYSVMVEKVPYSVMFLRSFIVDLMDRMEKVIPAFTPELLQDEQPSMRYLAQAGARLTKQPAGPEIKSEPVAAAMQSAQEQNQLQRLLRFCKSLFA